MYLLKSVWIPYQYQYTGVVMVVCLPLDPKFAGSNPAKAMDF
jgi:hypothetical protein